MEDSDKGRLSSELMGVALAEFLFALGSRDNPQFRVVAIESAGIAPSLLEFCLRFIGRAVFTDEAPDIFIVSADGNTKMLRIRLLARPALPPLIKESSVRDLSPTLLLVTVLSGFD